MLLTFAGVLLISLFVVGAQIAQSPVAPPREGDSPFVTLYLHPRNNAEMVLTFGDGQVWGALAQDPTFSHPEVMVQGRTEFVYRSSRPLFPILAWVVSAGRPDAVPWVVAFLSAFGVALMGAAAVALAQQDHRATRYAALAAFLPGSLYILTHFGPEPLATAFTMFGLYAWRRAPRRTVLAVALFAAAVLTREVAMLVPVALALHALIIDRSRWRTVAPLALPALPYLAWVGTQRVRFGAWPVQSTVDERLTLPFVGLTKAMIEMGSYDRLVLVLGIVLIAFAARRDARSVFTWIAAAFALFGVVMGSSVWRADAARVLLPMYAFGLLGVLPRVPVRAPLRTPAHPPAS